MKESELADIIIKYFEDKGYISYKEVSICGVGGSARADIYFVKLENEKIIDSIVVETKMSFSSKVIEQADKWKSNKLSHRVYVCTPFPKKRNSFLIKICKILGIGVIHVKDYFIKEVVQPECIVPKKFPPLFEEQKNSIAGNDRSEYITKFKLTVEKLDRFMEDKENYIWNELIEKLDHHYSNDKSASGALSKLIKRGHIKGYRIEKIDKKICLIKSNFNI